MKLALPFLPCFFIITWVQAQTTSVLDKVQFEAPIQRVTLHESSFKEIPSEYGNVLQLIPKGKEVKIVGLYKGFYRAVYGDAIGFIHFVFIDGDLPTFKANVYKTTGSRNYYDYENQPNDIVLFGKVNVESPLKVEPASSAETSYSIPSGSVVKITHHNQSYWQAELEGYIGYLGKAYVSQTGKTPEEVNIVVSPINTTKELFMRSDALLRESKRVLKASNSQYYIRGPRGGCYYITGSGRKQYVDRSLCD